MMSLIHPLAVVPALLAGAALLSGPAHADTEDWADIDWSSYAVDGETLAEVQDQMAIYGPNGFWAYTTWQVTWTGDCETTVTAAITLPELADDTALSDDDAEEFARMLQALAAHELQHVDFGVAYAAEIADAGCPANGADLLQPYVEAERDFDAETEHGRLDGVYLEDQ